MTARVVARVVIAAAVLLATTSAFAQVAQPPPRATRPALGGGPPPDPNRVRHDLTLEAYLMGGYQDNIGSFGQRRVLPGLDLRPSATMTMGNLGLQYFVGTAQKGLDIAGHGAASYASTYRNAGLPPVYAGDLSVGGQTGLGRRTQLSAHQSLQISPYASLGLFGGLHGGLAGRASVREVGAGGISGADGRVVNGFFEGLMWAANTSASLNHAWTRRTSTVFSYGFHRQWHDDRSLLNNSSHMGKVRLNRTVGRTGSVHGAYSFGTGDLQQRGRAIRRETHTLDGGFALTRDISRTRTLSLAVGGGATYIDRRDQVRQKFWLPVMHASGSVDLGRSWTLGADWRQSANVVPSPVFAPNTFLSHTVVVTLGGNIGSRVELVADAANSNGFIPTRAHDGSGSYKGYTGSAQVRVVLTRWWSFLAQINHYQAVLDDTGAETLGVPSSYHRNSATIGFGWAVPLLNAGARPQPVRGRRR